MMDQTKDGKGFLNHPFLRNKASGQSEGEESTDGLRGFMKLHQI